MRVEPKKRVYRNNQDYRSYDTKGAAKAVASRASRYGRSISEVIEYELVPTGKKFIKENNKWVEKQDEERRRI